MVKPTSVYAINSGKPWTVREVKYAVHSKDKPDDIAKKLGRSYNAIMMVQHKARWAAKFSEVL